MRRAEIATKQAVYTLGLLHAELAGKLLQQARGHPVADGHDAGRSRPEDASAWLQRRQHRRKRRNKSNPWFKRGTLYRSAVDVMRRAEAPMTAREIADALLADKAPEATRKQAIDLQAAILAALGKRDGQSVVSEGAPARWKLSQS
jgi:hypothetical protein